MMCDTFLTSRGLKDTEQAFGLLKCVNTNRCVHKDVLANIAIVGKEGLLLINLYSQSICRFKTCLIKWGVKGQGHEKYFTLMR